jgi:hypothetical protein
MALAMRLREQTQADNVVAMARHLVRSGRGTRCQSSQCAKGRPTLCSWISLRDRFPLAGVFPSRKSSQIGADGIKRTSLMRLLHILPRV